MPGHLLLFAFAAFVLIVTPGPNFGYYAANAGRWLRTRDALASRTRWLTATSFIGLGAWAALPDRR